MKMIRPGKMIQEVLENFFKKPATMNYPAQKAAMPKEFRGKLNFFPEKCSGCKLCEKDCPSNAIQIRKVGEKQFEADIDLGKCIYCGQCVDSCLKQALAITQEYELAQLKPENLKITIKGEIPVPSGSPVPPPAATPGSSPPQK